MSDRKVIYLIIEQGSGDNKRTFWRPAGQAYTCRDGSMNIKLDMFPALTFNAREPKSNGEAAEAEAPAEATDPP